MTTSQPREPLSRALSPEDFVAEPTAFPAHRWGFGAFLLVEAVLLASAAFIGALAGPTAPGRPLPIGTVLLGTMLPTMIAAGVAVLITVVRGNGPKLDLRLEWRWADVWTGLKFGMLGLVLTSLSAYVWTQLVGSADATSAISALVDDRKMSVPAAAVMFGYLWLLGPICEEIIYRGLLWGAVERLQWRSERWGRVAAFLLSTAVFAASHLEPLRTTLLLVISIPIGLARLSTGRLAGSIVAHAVNNFLPAVAILLGALGLASF
ncbi:MULTISPECIES: CPBP family intramembrane glutamic endopeptidase [Amycolatopsis]|uniref:CPBP family intramembrane metalloprotease n=1 Tax=Amycolatopsis dendrobii TaxID=2760662 RepID=A0A7W3W602_9PSEU|nr:MULTISPECIES: type II CAAX endopeptidase family protein [Amycolatopsis]MBB1158927.1 CPBP family intramembrane metalloprotease [Amycolatopsis dendrobii]UKD55087.1 CPBP family intramembrane metalloprotease [Amycolatopsis sp. FU40]